MIVSEGDDRALYDLVQEKNLFRQYDLLTNCVEIGLKQGHIALDKYTLWALNHVAVANISQFGGRFREEPIYVGNFNEGNGRTARATCYYLLCAKSGNLLPGKKIVPERIREDRAGYVAGLRAADRAWHEGNLDFSELEAYLARLLEAQLRDED